MPLLPAAIVIAWYHIVIAGLTGNLSTGNLEGKRCPIGVGHDEGKSEMPDRGRA